MTRVNRRDIHASDGTTLYPVLPTTTQVLYGIVMPYTPPTYQLEMPLKYNVQGVNLLVSKTSDVSVSGSNLQPGTPFTSQTGQQYLVYSAPPLGAGATFSATISNLPGIDNTPTAQLVVLLGGGLAGLILLGYPVYRRRTLASSRTQPASALPGASSDRALRRRVRRRKNVDEDD